MHSLELLNNNNYNRRRSLIRAKENYSVTITMIFFTNSIFSLFNPDTITYLLTLYPMWKRTQCSPCPVSCLAPSGAWRRCHSRKRDGASFLHSCNFDYGGRIGRAPTGWQNVVEFTLYVQIWPLQVNTDCLRH